MYKPTNISQDSKFWLIQCYAAKLMKRLRILVTVKSWKSFCLTFLNFSIAYPKQAINLHSQALCILCLYNYPENWHYLIILQLVWTFLTPLRSRCKSYFSWILTYRSFYLLTTHNCVKRLSFCMIGSFVNSDEVVWRFNGETFVKQSVKLVPSVNLLFWKFCYQESGH